MCYRPTVRYDEAYRHYIDELFHATLLDRNQLIRAALFTAAHSREFSELLSLYKKSDVPLPYPKWKPNQHGYWLEREYKPEEERRNANGTNERQSREIPSEPIRINNAGGISFTL